VPPLLPAWTLVQTHHVVARGFTAVFAEVGLTPVQFGVLAVVHDTPGPTLAELARAVMVRPQSAGEIADVLERRGLLHREGEAGRGRRRPLTITDAGREVLAAAWPGVLAFNTPDSLGLTPDEHATLDRLLRRVLERLA
jgi:DNA-binding MarR family transcriptional regulator